MSVVGDLTIKLTCVDSDGIPLEEPPVGMTPSVHDPRAEMKTGWNVEVAADGLTLWEGSVDPEDLDSFIRSGITLLLHDPALAKYRIEDIDLAVASINTKLQDDLKVALEKGLDKITMTHEALKEFNVKRGSASDSIAEPDVSLGGLTPAEKATFAEEGGEGAGSEVRPRETR